MPGQGRLEMSELRFDDRVAVVTGAGRGLGRAHALLLAARGAKVVVNDPGAAVSGEGVDATPAQAVVEEIATAGGAAVADHHSVADPLEGAAIVQAALDAYGRLDIVVNNAGILRDRSMTNMAPELVDAVVDVHLKGAFNVIRAAWPVMRGQAYGRIVNTTSNAGLLGGFGQSNYGAAKTGLVGLARVLAVEGRKYGIRVNVLAPIARTRMSEELLGPLAENLDPALVSPMTAWLAHEDCPVTGEIYSSCGGRVARYFIGLTPGFYDPSLSPEAVRDNFDTIRSEDGYVVHPDVLGEMEDLRRLFGITG